MLGEIPALHIKTLLKQFFPHNRKQWLLVFGNIFYQGKSLLASELRLPVDEQLDGGSGS